jgi:hypothetical protein
VAVIDVADVTATEFGVTPLPLIAIEAPGSKPFPVTVMVVLDVPCAC